MADYWWNDKSGMAASVPEKDYFHMVSNGLAEEKGEVNSVACNFYEWEIMSHDRAETLTLLEPYLNENIDLITLQLGENVQNVDTYEQDFLYLVEYIKERCRKAKIIVVGDFGDDEEKIRIKGSVVQKTGVGFADLAEIRGKEGYQCGLGTEVYDMEGNAHIVEHEGVAAHPGDKGMEYIAEKILEIVE